MIWLVTTAVGIGAPECLRYVVELKHCNYLQYLQQLIMKHFGCGTSMHSSYSIVRCSMPDYRSGKHQTNRYSLNKSREIKYGAQIPCVQFVGVIWKKLWYYGRSNFHISLWWILKTVVDGFLQQH